MFEFIKNYLLGYWWIISPLALFFIFVEFWLPYVRLKYIKNLSWSLLEIKIPRESMRTPKAMEQIFSGLHGIQSGDISLFDKYIKGKIPDWFSLEICGIGGRARFYIKTLSQYRNLVEAQIYAQYPRAEITEVDDYANSINIDTLSQNYDIWGSELMLTKEDAYPIRTYKYFEEDKEEKEVDPISSLVELFNKLNEGEHIWIQFLIRPIGDKWKKEGDKLVAKLLGRKIKQNKNLLTKLGEEVEIQIKDVARVIVFGEPPLGTLPSSLEDKKDKLDLSPGEKEIIKSIEENIAKLGFETLIRFLYVSPLSSFNRSYIAAIIGSFKQYNTQNLNGFKPNKKANSSVSGFFEKKRTLLKKRKLFNSYKLRAFNIDRIPDTKLYVFNTEELATVYHFPGMIVTAPTVERIEARRGEPPSTLPTL